MEIFQMKKGLYAGAAALLMCTMLGGCGNLGKAVAAVVDVVAESAEPDESGENGKETEEKTDVTAESVELNEYGDSIYRKEFGTYTVLDGWMESKTHSTDDKFFYVMEGHDYDMSPDNISINVGTNFYSEDEYMEFKDAIMVQILAQVSGTDAQINGSGGYTAAGDPLIMIEVIMESGTVTRYYYIVGDYRYCLVQLTNYSGDEEADRAAEIMADGFVWRD